MKKYCKAYYLKDLRQFSDWSVDRKEEEAELTDEDVVYLWDDLTVVKSPVIPDRGLLWDTVTPAWQDFCHATLQFSIPEDLRYAYEQDANQDNSVGAGEQDSPASA